MKKHNFPRCLPLIVVALLCAFSTGGAFCAPDSLRIPEDVIIKGQDHETLQGFFARFELARGERHPSAEVSQALYRALPDACKKSCEETVSKLGDGAVGTARMAVEVVYVAGGKEGKPLRALVSFACSSSNEAFAGEFHGERMAGLVISRSSSRLSLMKGEAEGEKSPEFVRIMVEKEIRIGGHDVVGLDFIRSNENASGREAAGILKEEVVNFYVFEDDGIKPAGSVLKEREERTRGGDGREMTSVYSAAVVFKKDMKGNIIGILSPFTLKQNDKRTDKGMVRYSWDSEKRAFVKE